MKRVLTSIDFVTYGQLPGAQARANSLHAKHLERVEEDERAVYLFKGGKMRRYPWAQIRSMNYDLVEEAEKPAEEPKPPKAPKEKTQKDQTLDALLGVGGTSR